MKEVKGGICAVKGVKAWGIKEGKMGLAIMLAKGPAAGVFTLNKVKAAPVLVSQDHLKKMGKEFNGIIANSGCANAFTHEQGVKDAIAMANLLAKKLNVDPHTIGVSSTGVIGRPMDMPWYIDHFEEVFSKLTSKAEGSEMANKAIMTTDLVPKSYAVEIEGGIRIGGICKGSGMIEPNMGTMLAFVFTDAKIGRAQLQKCLQKAVDRSFNMVVVDGDTSTNDNLFLIATGEAGKPADMKKFQEGLDTVCMELAKKVARDGEGATKLIEATVTGAKSIEDARLAAKAIIRSPLFKSAVYGTDPNWGRAVCAVGYSGSEIDPAKVSLIFSDGKSKVSLVDAGVPKSDEKTLAKAKKIMGNDTLYVTVELKLGKSSATAWGCDLTHKYVDINASYTT
ncbi:bifunctional ornithine acetyltransferase/N-acetylglutamate synthase [Methanocella arvoryzae]|uniref:Glutamate N-acetyltransferase n=1 Tax=Methanocella arvoryzae (strain DSM 22066 / NBRC 105507 / MRE50) TaxID=351160 RepID=Q0W930_METAR|nr:bifunctional ornithine acetyltransferase/N-acetylglutamate synthase [Methanocella arvoryzae]CAJ35096.1 arginine biosynthesis bifunctional protein (glutamate N-acetyltransferase, EC 2.3.1.35/ornithine acetyltransferase, EC 2.3.1.1) [Methanocella arvoryzae MRE50]